MEEDNKYKGWLLSNNILKRSFAVFGHYMLAYIIMCLIVFAIVVFFTMIAAFIGILV